jgi:hypothetical protein
MVEEVGLDPALLNPFHSPHQAVSHLSTNHQPARCAAPLGPYEARQHGALPWYRGSHPWPRPRAFSRENPLHVHAEVDAALGQKIGRSWSLIWGSALYAYPRVSTKPKRTRFLARLHALSPHVQDDGFVRSDCDRLSRAMRQQRAGQRRQMGERAARRVGLILAHDPEALLTPAARPNSGFLARPRRRHSCRRSPAPRGAQLQSD